MSFPNSNTIYFGVRACIAIKAKLTCGWNRLWPWIVLYATS